jgi:hypothetical protein
MTSPRRWLLLAAPAALAALVLAAPAASSAAPVAAHAKTVAADCETITNALSSPANLSIAGGGVNHPVSLTSPGNCFSLPFHSSYKDPYNGETYTEYEYQNGDGHCLFDNGGTIDVGAACEANHPNEEFYGLSYDPGVGWLWSNVGADGVYGYQTVVASQGCGPGNVTMQIPTRADCQYWNFP